MGVKHEGNMTACWGLETHTRTHDGTWKEHDLKTWNLILKMLKLQFILLAKTAVVCIVLYTVPNGVRECALKLVGVHTDTIQWKEGEASRPDIERPFAA